MFYLQVIKIYLFTLFLLWIFQAQSWFTKRMLSFWKHVTNICSLFACYWNHESRSGVKKWTPANIKHFQNLFSLECLQHFPKAFLKEKDFSIDVTIWFFQKAYYYCDLCSSLFVGHSESSMEHSLFRSASLLIIVGCFFISYWMERMVKGSLNQLLQKNFCHQEILKFRSIMTIEKGYQCFLFNTFSIVIR